MQIWWVQTFTLVASFYTVLTSQCIRSAMLKDTIPKLVVKTTAMLLSNEVERFMMPSVWQDLPPAEAGTKELHEFAPGGGQVNFISTWNIKSYFSLKIISATHVNVAEHKVGSRVCSALNPICFGVLKDSVCSLDIIIINCLW